MIQGTTPLVSYTLPFDVAAVKSAEFVVEYFAGNRRELIVKEKKDGIHEGNRMTFSLAQAETLKLPAGSWVNIQLRVLTLDGVSWATRPYRVEVIRLIKGGELQ